MAPAADVVDDCCGGRSFHEADCNCSRFNGGGGAAAGNPGTMLALPSDKDDGFWPIVVESECSAEREAVGGVSSGCAESSSGSREMWSSASDVTDESGAGVLRNENTLLRTRDDAVDAAELSDGKWE